MKQERGKAPLMLMEQVVMILVFALAAALCMQAFVTASLLSKRYVKEDRGANISQSVAEVIKEEHGDLEAAGQMLGGVCEEETLFLYYDEEWNPVSEEKSGKYVAQAQVIEKGTYFSQGVVQVKDLEKDEEIFSLDIGWQEVKADE